MPLPDRIRLARMARPMQYEQLVSAGADGWQTRVSVVDVATLDWYDLQGWPTQEIDVTGYRWQGWTWLGWTLVLMWKD